MSEPMTTDAPDPMVQAWRNAQNTDPGLSGERARDAFVAGWDAARSVAPEDAASDRSPDHLPQGVGVSNFPNRKCEACGEPWPCPNAYKPAALGPVPSPEPLDVARLARALHAMPHHYRGGADNDLARMACQQTSPSACEHKAASIAREYARLAAPQPVPEDET